MLRTTRWSVWKWHYSRQWGRLSVDVGWYVSEPLTLFALTVGQCWAGYCEVFALQVARFVVSVGIATGAGDDLA
jgi:hypothetical protein